MSSLPSLFSSSLVVGFFSLLSLYTLGGPGTYGSASNVISAAFVPAVGAGVLYAAWEEGSGQHTSGGGDWVPACCSTFVKIDLEKWW